MEPLQLMGRCQALLACSEVALDALAGFALAEAAAVVAANVVPMAAFVLGTMLKKGRNARLRALAAVALGKMGPAAASALPQLITALEDEDAGMQAAASGALGKILPAVALKNQRALVLAAASDAWCKIGPAAAGAVPQLIMALENKDPEVRAAASDALGKIGPAAADALPQLIAALEDTDARVRAAAAETFGKIGPAAVDALPQLIMVLKDTDARVRAAAAETFGKIGPAAADALPQLIMGLKDTDARVRAAAAETFGKIGPAAADALPHLIMGLKETDARVRAADALPQLIMALQDTDARVRAAASEAFGKIGPAAADALPQLIMALQDTDARVRAAASEALGKIFPAVADAVPQLVRAFEDEGALVRDVCSRAVSLPREDLVDWLAKVDPRYKVHGLLLQLVLFMHSRGGASLDPIVAKGVVHSIWCGESKDVIRSALEALPESMKVLELSTFQQRWLVQRTLQMVPNEAVQCKLHELLLEPRWGHDPLYPAEQAISKADSSNNLSDQLAGLGPVDTDASLSHEGSCLQDDSLACSSGDGVPAAMCACPWSRDTVASACSDISQMDRD